MDEPSDLLDDESDPPEHGLPVGEAVPLESASANGSAAGNMDRKQAADVYRKVLAGQELTVREQTALKRFEKEKEERLRWQYYASIPQKHWRDMSGRQAKVINEQAGGARHPHTGACPTARGSSGHAARRSARQGR